MRAVQTRGEAALFSFFTQLSHPKLREYRSWTIVYVVSSVLHPAPFFKLYKSGILGVSESYVEARLRARPLEEDYYMPSPFRTERLQNFVTTRARRLHVSGR